MKNIFLIQVFILSIFYSNSFGQNYPSGFSQVSITNGISNPTTFDFAPDGRIFVAQQDGALRVIKNGSLLPTVAIDLNVISDGECGLIGVAVHPQFASNNYIYLYYTVAAPTKRNKISRFTFSGDVINQASEILILELDPLSSANIHNGGCMRFTQDGKLMVSVGENNNSANSQSLNSYLGKILRVNLDGTPPTDNPFASGTTRQSKSIWAMGLRNPFTFDIHQSTGKIYVNEVGHALYEEINDATTPAVNFGWPIDQGVVQGTNYTNPVFAYAHSNATITGCAISGGAFFKPASTNYPSSYIGKYFFMDYCSDFIRFLDPEGNTSITNSFATNIPGTPLSLRTGPDGNIYFLSRTSGALYKIVYSLNTNPVITDQPDDATIAKTQSLTLSVSVSGAPPFNYQWKKNGSNISGATSSTYTLNNAALSDDGNYSVTITNSSGSVSSRDANISIIVTSPPVANIVSPANGTLYKAGDIINFNGTGIDEEDGDIPASAFTWKVEFFHGTGTHQHVHDGPPIADGVKSGSFTIPNNNETAVDVFYRLILIVKDSKGISNSKSVDILPRTSSVSLATSPVGFRVLLEGEPRNTPFTFKGVEGIERTLGVITPQVSNGTTYKFDRWAHGGLQSQIISTPANDFTYTAIFTEDIDLREPDNAGATASGIKYNYYEGDWLVLPDFNTLTPVKTGTVETFSLTPKNRTEKFAFKYTGYIDILNDGVYKFYSNSNDGSKVFIGDRLIINNDGQHGNVEVAGTIGLKKGKHQITVTYFQYNAGSLLVVSYSADGLSKQAIPASRLFYSTGGSGNMAPVTTIASPLNNQQYNSSPTITISATASDNDGSISKVEFYQGEIKLGEDLNAPYQYTWDNVADGNYALTSKAYDNLNVSTTSSIVSIKVGSINNTNCNMDGNIIREYWTGVTGQGVSSIPVNLSPVGTQPLTTFEGPQNWGDNYGSRIRGFICAPTTGIYYFFISSNDNGELWLSTDQSPANKVRIASISTFSNYREWAKMSSQKSVGIQLIGGSKYYIEALQKEGSNSDHISVGWQLPNGTLERPIPGNNLSPFQDSQVNNAPSVAITSPMSNQRFTPSSTIVISASASDSDGAINKVEFYQGTLKLGEDVQSPFQYSWSNVQEGIYNITAKAFDNNNASRVSAIVTISVGNNETCTAQGSILREYWAGVSGQTVVNIPTQVAPSGSQSLLSFEGPQNWGDNYGSRIRGYICPPVTGDYYFWVSSNDASELWLSTDETSVNKKRIAFVSTYTLFREWTKVTSQKSIAISLEAGKSYYIEALQKEGINSDHISVGWQLPDGTLERPIPGSRLSPYNLTAAREVESISLTSEVGEDTTYKILVYPNPIERGLVTLAIEGYKGKAKAGISIVDLNGNKLYGDKANCDRTCARTLINIDERFLPGTYIIYVDIESKMYYQKLIIK
jgi:glucose/arabinose dehydrogenase